MQIRRAFASDAAAAAAAEMIRRHALRASRFGAGSFVASLAYNLGPRARRLRPLLPQIRRDWQASRGELAVGSRRTFARTFARAQLGPLVARARIRDSMSSDSGKRKRVIRLTNCVSDDDEKNFARG